MKLSDQVIDEMIKAGLIVACGGTGDEVSKVVSTVKGCDEATVILRKAGKAVGVLVVAETEDRDGATQRGQAVLASLQ